MIKAVIFDMDGTVLNTLEDLTDSVNAVIPKYGFSPRTPEEVRSFVGNGLTVLIDKATDGKLERNALEKVCAEFSRYYDSHCIVKTKPYEGITEAINDLRKSGYKTALVSNKRDTAVTALCASMFPGCFDITIGDKPGIKRKPSSEPVEFVYNTLSLKPEECVYVGDSEVDILTARNSGTGLICVTWGFRDKEFLSSMGADVFADNAEDLLNIIKKEN